MIFQVHRQGLLLKGATNMTNFTMLVAKLHKSLIIVYNHL